MQSLWTDAEALDASRLWAPRWGEDLALRVYTSRLLGRAPSLVLHGGGNTSVKGVAREITREEVRVLFVKGSGWDLTTIEPEGFPACRMQPLLACLALEKLSDENMVKALRSQMLDPASPTPSVEALLHAFLPGRYVDHTHSNAVLAVVDQPDGAARARDVWGEDVLIVPYVMPGFALARRVAQLGERVRGKSVMILDQHGIFTWGDTARESYERMIEAVSAAERYVDRARSRISAPPAKDSGAPERRRRQRLASPIVRGALSRAADGGSFVLSWRDEPDILALLDRPDFRTVTQQGPMTPDHVLRTKPVPALLEDLPLDPSEARARVEAELARYADWYSAYFADNAARDGGALTRLGRLPRVLTGPGP